MQETEGFLEKLKEYVNCKIQHEAKHFASEAQLIKYIVPKVYDFLVDREGYSPSDAPENFCLFLSLLDKDVYGDVQSLEEAMKRHDAPFYLRRIKEALVTFPDPETGKVKTLFTKRNVQTTEFQIDDDEWELLRSRKRLRN